MKHISFRRNGKEFKPTRAELEQVLDDYAERLTIIEKALELACEELYDSDSISICAYCPYDIQDECADECPQNTKVLEKYFKTKAKEMMKNDTSL